jgi:signal transduction histidine kinase
MGKNHFDAQKQFYRADGQMGMGLSALALRCRMISAKLSLDSAGGKGTRWIICLPCPNLNPKGIP